MTADQTPPRLFDTRRLREALDVLAQRLDALGIEGQIFLLGGAALALGYYEEGERRLTADVDAWFTPPGAVSAAAEVLATEMHVPADWLNDKAVPSSLRTGSPKGSPCSAMAAWRSIWHPLGCCWP